MDAQTPAGLSEDLGSLALEEKDQSQSSQHVQPVQDTQDTQTVQPVQDIQDIQTQATQLDPPPLASSPGLLGQPYASQKASATPPTRKRISMNFALPVVSSSTESPIGSSRRTVSSSASRKSPKPIEVPSVAAMTSSGSPAASPLNTMNGIAGGSNRTTVPRHGHNLSHSSSSSSGSAAATTATGATTTTTGSAASTATATTPAAPVPSFDGFFSELAAKERRVLELRDELSRIKVQLKLAENDLKQFRDGAASAVGNVQTPRMDHHDSNAAADGLSPSSPTSRKSMLASLKNMSPQQGSPSMNFGSGNLLKNSSAHLPPPEDVINMGKRVVEEIGSQFWTFVGDIKNVAIGEDSRDYPDDVQEQHYDVRRQQGHEQGQSPKKSALSDSRPSIDTDEFDESNDTIQANTGGDEDLKHTRNKRSVSVNSYYQL